MSWHFLDIPNLVDHLKNEHDQVGSHRPQRGPLPSVSERKFLGIVLRNSTKMGGLGSASRMGGLGSDSVSFVRSAARV